MICEEPFGSNYCFWCLNILQTFELIDVCFFMFIKKRPRTWRSFDSYIVQFSKVIAVLRRLVYLTKLTRACQGLFSEELNNSSHPHQKTYPVSFQGPLQCPVPDGLISISQITTSVNYFFTFFDKIYTGSISIVTIIKDLIIYKSTLRHVYISFCAGCLHYLFSNTKSTATRTIALAPTRACIFPKSLPAASANSLVCAAI